MAVESRHERPVRRGRVDDTGGDAEGGKLYYHLTILAEIEQRATRTSSSCRRRRSSRATTTSPASTGSCSSATTRASSRRAAASAAWCCSRCSPGDEAGALKKAARLQDIFGREGFFIELQDHGLDAQRTTNPQLVEIARALGAPLLATNDSHYTHRADATAHDALLCVQTGALLDDEKRFRFHGTEHYLKSAVEMRQLFGHLEEACDNTLLIAERANVEIEFGRPSLPEFEVPARITGASYEARAAAFLRELTYDGARHRYGDPVPDDVRARLDYELGVIEAMGFPAYFLVVWDLIRYARENRIRVGPGRGSAASSCVAYCLRIVDLDPLRYDLLFERFLNPGRKEMPDIDLDFDERYRGQVIQYASERYGTDHVAQIVTFSTIKARAAVRDAARVLGYDFAMGDRIAKAMPPLVMGRDTPLAACFEKDPEHEDGYAASAELRRMCEEDAAVRRTVEVARGLEGLRRQDGIHAAAVVITNGPLHRVPPDPAQARRPGAHRGRAGRHPVRDARRRGARPPEDRLPRPAQPVGARAHAATSSRRTPGARPDLDALPLDDPEVFAMLSRGDSIGVFQLEGAPMRALMRRLAPSSFDDVAALVALYRPGPDGGEHAQPLRRPEERPRGDPLRAPRPRAGAEGHLRAHDLPGVRHARRTAHGGVLRRGG